jgi:hypothetical protein
MEERNPWDKEEGESTRWFSRFNQFRLMKPWERSVAAVYRGEKKGEKGSEIPPGSWYETAKIWKWKERVAAYDKSQLDERDRQIAAEEADVWRTGLALKHERVKELEAKARLIEESWHDPNTKKVFFPWMTADKIREWRGCLEDIAKIKNEHIKKQEITGKDGTPLVGSVGLYDPESKKDAVRLPRKIPLGEALQRGHDAGSDS